MFRMDRRDYLTQTLMFCGYDTPEGAEARAEASDWAVNTLREACDERRIHYTGRGSCPCPSCGCGAGKARREDLPELLSQERRRCIEQGIPFTHEGLLPYLRCRRDGSEFRLNRKLRCAVFAQLVARRLRETAVIARHDVDQIHR